MVLYRSGFDATATMLYIPYAVVNAAPGCHELLDTYELFYPDKTSCIIPLTIKVFVK
jgi:hypothetical protein